MMTPSNTHCVLPSGGAVVSIGGADLNTQHGWWIKQPQADDYKEQFSISPFQLDGIIPPNKSLFLGHGSGSKRLDRKPPAAPLFFVALFCGCPIHLCTQLQRTQSMIYTFLIAPKGLKLSQLNRVRLVSCYAPTLSVARSAFVGLSLALVSRKPLQHGGRTQ